ncbi:alpha/beta hydrolase [Mycolicibacterium murale]|jgi:acetyl esterase|uniref:alpha/beta hydrolase n=1 Tax=Mycolicibacterium murale TaxID=182220 RepID=UPI001874A3DE|nr:alpha/beta hydrolase [Mycolicibacterium murale]MCV7186274.1 alpha/beta hydrolase [Mycolicibacterium murale]
MSPIRLPLPVLRVGSRVSPALFSALPAPVLRGLSGFRSVVIDGNTLDPRLQLFLASARLTGVTGMVTDGDVPRSRAVMHETCVGLGGPARAVPVQVLSIPGPAAGVAVRHYRAAGATDAVVYFHGGGFALGDLDSYHAVCSRICQDAGVHVFSVDYRLAPEHPAPAAVDDCSAAYAWITAHAAELGITGGVAVAGDSAGGALAAVVARWAARSDVPTPSLQFLIYPVTDLAARTRSRTLFGDGFVLTGHDLDFFRRAYLDGSGVAVTDPRVAPLLAHDLTGLPPALVVTAGFDPLRDEGEQYAEALAAAGVPVDLRRMGSMTHGFINFAGLGGAVERHLAELISALRAHLRRGDTGVRGAPVR